MRRRQTWFLRLGLLLNLTGALMLILAGTMLPSAILAAADHSADRAGQWAALGISAVAGLLLFLATRRVARTIPIGHREGFLIAGFGWLSAGLIGALPYYLYAHLAPDAICGGPVNGRLPIGAEFCDFTNTVFESMSGFTTTGASIISDGLWTEYGISGDRLGLPRGILLWRSMTHFIGGMGIIVLGVAILPLLGVGGMQLYKAEVPGPTKDKLAPRVGETAKLLWKVYIILSSVLFVLLAMGGMDAFEAVCHTMATMATGGFSTRAASVAGFNSAYFEWIITLFMFLAGMNFTLHFVARSGDWRVYLRDAECRLYTIICVVSIALVTGSLLLADKGFGPFEALRIAAFQVLSIITTTGYASHDFEQWTYAPVALLVMVGLMLIGGMAGSTGGGIKVVRHQLAVKLWVRELFYLSHPRATRPVRLGGRVVPPDVLRAVAGFIAVYIALAALGTFLYAVDGKDLISAFTCSISSLGNIGPGLGDVGPYDNYAVLSGWAKWVSAIQMVLGRLEIYTLLVLVSPSFWRR
ncbi:MAG: TrkH family potassium uptake protein [Myxococcales bacterium]|nr:TrkH family potassium uptake protein [Myxococcales bacterium]MCB9549924.1 TrkH family potassium uptake protein [Myxococcales bacterium]